jgi:L-lactate dehydrogenase complex protein LldF
MLGSEFHEMLRCIRCGACMNHCPVYSAIGGHAYGSFYPGPMGAVLTPQLIGIDEAAHLPNASTFCGRCQAVCPMNISLPKMMRHWREREFSETSPTSLQRLLLRCWSFLAINPSLYRAVASIAARALSLLAGRKRRFSALPFAGGWTKYRDFPAPAPRTFQSLWRERQRRKESHG